MCNFRVSIETRFRPSTYLLQARPELDRWWGPVPTLFPADAGTPSIDRHSGQWHAWNVTKWPGQEATGGARPGKRNGRSAPGQWAGESPPTPIGHRWTNSWRRGQMGTWNGRQRPGLRRLSACVETQAGITTCGRNRRPAPRYGRPQAHHQTWPDDRPTSQWSFLFAMEADWSDRICTDGPMQWCN